MATTGLWPIKGNLNDLVKYAENPEKTTGLADVLHYAANEWKTEKCMYRNARYHSEQLEPPGNRQ